MKHALKIKQCYLLHIMEGRKTFDVRQNDRDFQVGDEINYLPLESADYNCYGDGEIPPHVKIIYVHAGLGMADNYVVLGIEPIQA